MRFNNLGDVTAYLCVPGVLALNGFLALSRLRGVAKFYYIYLLGFSVPYVVGNICDAHKLGPLWVQWHLLDVSYEPWAMVLGTAIYLCVMKAANRPVSQRVILIAASVSLVVFTAMANAWEVGQNWLAWQRHEAIDWSDYTSYVDGFILAIAPFIFSKRLRACLVA